MKPAEPAIFIIDDDPSVSGALRRLMRTAGFGRIEEFNSAEDFLKRADIDSGSIMIIDVMLPGISGIELRQFIRSTGLAAATVFISAQEKELEKARSKCPEAGAFLLKPFGGEDLLTIIRTFVSRQAAGSTRDD
ncbi:MAG: response regulator [Desulfobacterales bacterium]|nr:response regulator [Desulfobacterales bacterium]